MEGYVSTAQAARIIGCDPRHVRGLCVSGALVGEKVGRDWLVSEESAQAYAKGERKPGPKPKESKKPAPKKGKK